MTRAWDFVAEERSVSVLLILIAVLGLGGLVLRLFVFQSWFLWFWAMTALTAFELLVVAFWDLIVDLRRGSVHLVTNQPAPWGPWVQWSLVPLLLLAGILFDHFVTH
ncbi:MAG: hypothetical protein E6J53_09315 [Chloroflexi bacterium]|nr:MAG: hypothetical protein E6J53_09315 [Chloroflexota bacterium]